MMEGITIIVLEEILMANGLTVLMMWFLLFCRRKNRESLHVGDKIYDGIAIVNLVGALSETIAFLVDGKQFTGSRQINYISNSICFIGTVSMGMLWCMYVELRIYLVYHSKKQGVNLNFFPVIYFVGPCFAGVVLQFLFYGITSSWVLVAVALIFVQMQSYAESLYMDELSGLYNRRYFNAVLAEKKIASHKSLYGIMMDVNDFKCINDNLGHSTGDKAICTLGNILIRSIPDDGMAIRYAGDEFIVLLSGVDTERVLATMEEINRNLSRFNESGIEPFHLSVSMGYTEFGTEDDAETFLMHMDEKMYEEKRKYHMRKKSAGLENKV